MTKVKITAKDMERVDPMQDRFQDVEDSKVPFEMNPTSGVTWVGSKIEYVSPFSGTTYTVGADPIQHTPTTKDLDDISKGLDAALLRAKKREVETPIAKNPYRVPPPTRAKLWTNDRDEEHDDDENREEGRPIGRFNYDYSSDKQYQDYMSNLKKTFELYLETKNVIYLYKVILNGFENHLKSAYSYDPSPSKKHTYPLDTLVNRDCMNIIGSLVSSDLTINSDVTKDVTDLLILLYNGELYKKTIHVGIVTFDMYNSLINKLVSKSIKIDPAIVEKVKSTDFTELLHNGDCLTFRYYTPLKAILLSNGREDGYGELFMGLGLLHKLLDELPTVVETKELEVDNIILIDGAQFSKSAFESMVESGYDSFISNLKLETLIENKDIADNSVVEDVKLKLM